MKTKNELNKLNNAIYDAMFEYRNAIEDNLKECGKEMAIVPDDEDEKGLRLLVRGDNDDLNDQVIDKVRWNEKEQCVEYHLIEYNYKKCDDWYQIFFLDDWKDYVYERIDWGEEEPQAKIKIWTITKQSVYNFNDSGISTRVYADKKVAQAEFDAMRSSSREEDEKNKWYINCDTDTYYESYCEFNYVQYHTLIYLEEHEI